MQVVVWIVLALVLLAGSAVLTAEETSSSLLTRSRIKRLEDAGRRGAVNLSVLAEQPSRLHAAAAAARAACFAAFGLAGWILTGLLSPPSLGWLEIVGGIVGVGIGFSLGEALPRVLAMQNPEGVALAFASPARPLVSTARGFASLCALPWQGLMRLTGAERPGISPWADEDEFRTGATDDEESARDEAEEAMIDAVSEFTDKVVREVMVPRTDMAALPDTASAAEAIEMIESQGYSRLPVYRETVDDVRGVLYAKDLLSALAKGSVESIAEIARPPYFVPETKPIDELFVEMRVRTHIAIVADEYGGTAGLVTIEDLLEELVGEIFDEFDREEPLVAQTGEATYRVDARLPIDDVNELFGTDIDVEADTIGGVVSVLAGHIPEVGERVEVEGLEITVLEREGTRVRKLEIGPKSEPKSEESHDA